MIVIPAISVVVQLHYCPTVALQSGIIFTVSIHIPHHCRTNKNNLDQVFNSIREDECA